MQHKEAQTIYYAAVKQMDNDQMRRAVVQHCLVKKCMHVQMTCPQP
jgi:hypothetical protein